MESCTCIHMTAVKSVYKTQHRDMLKITVKISSVDMFSLCFTYSELCDFERAVTHYLLYTLKCISR